MTPESRQPLLLTADARIDAALGGGWDAVARALATAGAARSARWLAQRANDLELAESVEPLFAALTGGDAEERADSLFALAEIAEELSDDALTDTLLEGALESAEETGDADAIAEAVGRLASLAERLGDPLAAAEYWIAFLNWRRQAGHSSDPETVETAFDEVARLALADGAHKAAAIWTYRQSGFTRLLEADDERGGGGDWEADPAPYGSWD